VIGSILLSGFLLWAGSAEGDPPAAPANFQEYQQASARARRDPDAQVRLALWCEDNGLKEQATAHLSQVLKRDPRRDAAWKHLGFKKAGARWIKPETLAPEKAEIEAQSRASKVWKPRLEKWRDALVGRDKGKKAEAEQSLLQFTDPRAIPAVMAVFGRGKGAQERIALEILGQIDSPGASRALATMAVFSGSDAGRGHAIQLLCRRDVREFADLLIALVRQPIEFEVKRVQGPGSSGELLIKGQGSQPNLKRVYFPPAAPEVAFQPGDRVVYDSSGFQVIRRPITNSMFGTPMVPAPMLWTRRNSPVGDEQRQRLVSMMARSGLGARANQLGQQIIANYQNQTYFGPTPYYQFAMESGLLDAPTIPGGTQLVFHMGQGVDIPIGKMMAESQNTAVAADQQLERDVQSIREYNNSLRELNDRVVPVLQDVSGLALGPRKQEWQNWFTDQIGFQSPPSRPSETQVVDVPLEYRPQVIPVTPFVGPIAVQRMSCFAAGTLVHTLSGPRPIQDLAVGDQVLSQNTRNGALDYHPVLWLHRNPPSRTFRVTLGDEVLISSAFHRFWKAGCGWVMARDLTAGDPIRTLNGIVKVAKIEDGRVVPVFNLDIAKSADFFVGRSAALVHDNSLPDLRQPPFDGPPSPDIDSGSLPAKGAPRPTGSSRP
jgi:hypothetical protein